MAASIKCVLVGDSAVGKYRLIESLTTGKFSSDSTSSYMEEVRHTLSNGRRQSVMNIVKTPGQEGYDEVRQLFYPQTDVFIICFALNSPDSLKNAADRWYPEIMRHCPDIPILLVGTKLDLRADSGEEEEDQKSVSRAEAQTVALKVQAADYLECSALTGENVAAVFDKANKTASRHLNKVKRFSAMRLVADVE